MKCLDVLVFYFHSFVIGIVCIIDHWSLVSWHTMAIVHCDYAKAEWREASKS